MNQQMDLQIKQHQPNTGNGLLQFSKIAVSEEYSKEWNIHENDFIGLTRNGELLRNVLYRIGGLNTPKLNEDEYFCLIKHVEAFYSKDIMKISKSNNPKHLQGVWCILDKNGNEKVEFPPFKSPYLVKDSCIYSLDNNYYNIETGEKYGCYTYSSVQSKEFLFLDNSYDKDNSKRGVMKINKKDGTFELFR